MCVPTLMTWKWLFARPKRPPQDLSALFKKAAENSGLRLLIANLLCITLSLTSVCLSSMVTVVLLLWFTYFANKGPQTALTIILFFITGAFCVLIIMVALCISVVVFVGITRHTQLVSDEAIEAIVRRAIFIPGKHKH